MSSIPSNIIEMVRASGVATLPDNPSAKGLSATQIKGAIQRASAILANYLKGLGEDVDTINEETIPDAIDEAKDYTDELDALAVHLAGTETITGQKVFENFVNFKGQVRLGNSSSDNNKLFDVYYTTNLRGPVFAKNILPVNLGFSLGSSEYPWEEVFAGRLRLSGNSDIYALTESNGELAFRVGPASLYTNWNLPAVGPYNKTIASTDDVATAKSEAISSAASTAQSKVDALATAMESAKANKADVYTKQESDGKYVGLSGNQTIAGTKTFSGRAIVPETPRGSADAASKSYVDGKDSSLREGIDSIEALIPDQASESNQLADKDFVNSSINNIAAFYITRNAAGDAFETYAQLMSTTVFYSGGEVRALTRNDYCIVRADEQHNGETTRYTYQGEQWEFQYSLNNTPFTAEQLAAINSGITSALVGEISENADDIAAETARAEGAEDDLQDAIDDHEADHSNPHQVTKAQVGLGNVDNTSDLNKPISTATQTALNALSQEDLKTLYNLGAYDSVVVNGDGTATITRQTGYLTINGLEQHSFGDMGNNYYRYRVFGIDAAFDAGGGWGVFKASGAFSSYPHSVNGYNRSIGIDAQSNCFVIKTEEYTTDADIVNYIKRNPITIQYKLASATQETVIAGYPAYQHKYADRSLYNLGAFDSYIDGSNETVIVTRQTGYLNLKDIEWFYDSGNDFFYTQVLFGSASIRGIVPADNDTKALAIINVDSVASRNTVATYGGFGVASSGAMIYKRTGISTLSALYGFFETNGVAIQYRLQNASTENLIKKRPLNTLDRNGSDWLRNEWKKTLNLLSKDVVWLNHYNIDTNGNLSGGAWYQEHNSTETYIEIKPNTTYTFICNGGVPTRMYFFYYDAGKNYVSNAYTDTRPFTLKTPSGVAYIRIDTFGSGNQTALTNAMLVEGSVPYPYAEYDASGHIGNSEAQLLIDEYKKTANLFYEADNVISNLTINSGTSQYFNYPDERTVYVPIEPNTTYTVWSSKYLCTSECDVIPYNRASTTSGHGVYVQANMYLTFTTKANSKYFVISGSVSSWEDALIMLVKGDSLVLYQPYDASRHLTNGAGALLLDEYAKTENLLAPEIEQGAVSGGDTTAGKTYEQNKVASTNRLRTKGLVELDERATYTISVASGFQIVVQAYDASGNAIGNSDSNFNNWKTGSITFKGYPYYAFAIRKTDESAFGANEFPNTKAMLAKSGTSVPYQPYCGKIMHAIDVVGVKLWENADPLNSFEGRITGLPTLADYKFLDIYYKATDTTTSGYLVTRCSGDANPFFLTFISTTYRGRGGNVEITSINFGPGYENGQEKNTVCIPYAIYGIK